MLTVEKAISILIEKYGEPKHRTTKIMQFVLPDGRELCLEHNLRYAKIWLEDKERKAPPTLQRYSIYASDKGRHHHLSPRLNHDPPEHLRAQGFPIPVLSVKVSTERQLMEVLDWYHGTTADFDRKALEEMQQAFLCHYPDFASFAEVSGGYWDEERHYKQGLIDRTARVLAEAGGMSATELGHQLLEILCRKPSNLLGWRSVNLIDAVRQEAPGAIEEACARLALSSEPADTAIENFVAQVWPLFARGREKSLPYSESRSLPTMIMALAHPDKMLAVRYEPMFNAGRRLLRRGLFANAPLTAVEVRNVLQMGQRILEVMRDEWGWQPRDLWDVQGFIWVTCQGKAQQSEGEEQVLKTDSVRQEEVIRLQARNVILYGPPGTGKTYATMEMSVRLADGIVPGERNSLRDRYEELRETGRIEFVTFHQAYSYEEFVEGLRPVPNVDGAGFHLEPRPGVFRRIADRALEEFKAAQSEGRQALEYVLLIDEINRANISKVFGELITLLEADKRYGAENAQAVTLPYSGETFIVPPNLHVVATMNTADRSIALLDTALRRRFQFEELMPNPSLLTDNLDGINLAAVLEAINDRIEYLFDRDHQIGHAYFMSCKTRADMDEVMRRKVIPLLVEYFYEDWEKVRAVLNEDEDSGAFIRRAALQAPRLLANEEASYEPRWRYQVRETFANDAYERLIG